MKRVSRSAIVIIYLSICHLCTAQIELTNIKELERIKNGTTYITFKDTNSAIAKQYMDIYRKYWTISKIKFINDTDIDLYVSPESSFFNMTCFDPTVAYVMYNPIYAPVYNGNYTSANNEYSSQLNTQMNSWHKPRTYKVTYLYMSLWTYKLNYLKKKNKREPDDNDEITIARIALFPDYQALIDPESIFQYDYDWGGHINNWSPEILKNYLLGLDSYFNAGKQIFFKANEIANKNKLVDLKTQTLYIPDYILNIYGGVGRDQSQKHIPEDLFKDYMYSYKIISTKELDSKIATDQAPFYYLIYVKDCGNKLITISDSQIGEVVYSTYTQMSYNVKPGDFKDISNAIKRSK